MTETFKFSSILEHHDCLIRTKIKSYFQFASKILASVVLTQENIDGSKV